MDIPTLPPTLLAAWRALTPGHQALVLTMIETLADEDRGIAQTPTIAYTEAPVRASEPSDFGTMIRNLAMQGTPPSPEPTAWLRSVGMFDTNPAMDEIWEAGHQIREAERAGSR